MTEVIGLPLDKAMEIVHREGRQVSILPACPQMKDDRHGTPVFLPAEDLEKNGREPYVVCDRGDTLVVSWFFIRDPRSMV